MKAFTGIRLNNLYKIPGKQYGQIMCSYIKFLKKLKAQKNVLNRLGHFIQEQSSVRTQVKTGENEGNNLMSIYMDIILINQIREKV